MSHIIHMDTMYQDRMSIFDLWRLVFKFTFNKKACAHTAKRTIEDQLLKWNGYIRLCKARELERFGLNPEMQHVAVGKKGSVLDEWEYQLGLMCSWVVREEKGEFESKVENYTRHKIDYRLVQPMCLVHPECNKLRNFAKGRWVLKEDMRINPQNYTAPKRFRHADDGIK